MIHAHIGSLDLNLLVALDLLLSEGSVSAAARKLGLTQSAVSRSLARLRDAFGDELLVRTGHGMRPTRRALELAAPLRRALEDLDSIVARGTAFDPERSRRSFSIAAVDYAQVGTLGPLSTRLERIAPNVDLSIRHVSADAERDLESGNLDLLVVPQQPSGAGIVWSPLHDDGYTCIVWEGHSCRRLTQAAYVELPHVLVAPRERPGGIVDEVLSGHGLSRRVAVLVPTFLVVPHVLVGTRRIATVPTRIARLLVAQHPLRTLELPIHVPRFTMCQAWHELHRADPAHAWLRAQVAAAARRPQRSRGSMFGSFAPGPGSAVKSR